MADLTSNFAGIKSPNPFWLAGAPMGKLAADGTHKTLSGEEVNFAGA